jgi:hypothetical protein
MDKQENSHIKPHQAFLYPPSESCFIVLLFAKLKPIDIHPPEYYQAKKSRLYFEYPHHRTQAEGFEIKTTGQKGSQVGLKQR